MSSVPSQSLQKSSSIWLHLCRLVGRPFRAADRLSSRSSRLKGGLLVLTLTSLAAAQEAPDFHHLYTFGSKPGIHPPRLLNRRPAAAALGESDHPYGLAYPVAVTTDARRRVWISDAVTASVHIFDPATGEYREIRRVAGTSLAQPSGIVTDVAGRIYLVDSGNSNVFVFDETGEFDRALFRRNEHPLQNPSAIALSEDGRTIYVADPPRNVVMAFNREGEVTATILLPEEARGTKSLQVIQNQLYALGGNQHRVVILSPAGRQRGEMRWEGVAIPISFTYDPGRGHFLVANPRVGAIQVFDTDGRALGAFGRRGDALDEMQRADALYIDPHGLIYAIDSQSGKVLVFAEVGLTTNTSSRSK